MVRARDTRTKYIQVRLTPAEAEQLSRQAKTVGVSMSRLIRDLVFGEAGRARPGKVWQGKAHDVV
jgi:hypothetical protein